jgi:hypothetical protein
MSTITKDAFVPKNHKLSLNLELPASAPTGAVVITLTVKPRDAEQTTPGSDKELAQFMNSPLFGAWSDREDIGDPSEWVRSIRKPRDFGLSGAEDSQ